MFPGRDVRPLSLIAGNGGFVARERATRRDNLQKVLICARVSQGESEFDIDELLENNDLRTPIVHAISEMVERCSGIEHSAVHDIGVPCQNTISVMPEVSTETEDISEIEAPDMSI